jgi:acetyl-CoA acetyltransferase
MKLQRYMYDHGISNDALVRVAVKAYANGALNPNAWRRKALSYEEIAESPMLNEPLRKYMFCSPAEGGAALVLASASAARKFGGKPVTLRAAAIRTRNFGSFEVFSPSLALARAPQLVLLEDVPDLIERRSHGIPR